jgi:hypothetical protein
MPGRVLQVTLLVRVVCARQISVAFLAAGLYWTEAVSKLAQGQQHGQYRNRRR